MFIEGYARRPRLAPPTPDDVAAIWLRLSRRQQAALRQRASDAGATVEQTIRERVEHCQRVLRGDQITPPARSK